NDLTISVGLGTGGKSEQLAHLTALIGLQKEALAAGKSNLVSDANLYNSAKEFVKLVGLKNADAYFTDPRTQAAPDPALAALERQAEVEKLQAQADIATQQKKAEAEIALAREKFELERQLKLLDAQIKREQHQHTMTQSLVQSLAAPGQTGGQAGPDGQPGEHPMLKPVLALIGELKRANAPRHIV